MYRDEAADPLERHDPRDVRPEREHLQASKRVPKPNRTVPTRRGQEITRVIEGHACHA